MLEKNVTYYQYWFQNLSVAKNGDKVAPHKPLLLLSVIDLVESKIITSPIIELSNDLIISFSKNAKLYTESIDFFKPNIGMPFFYMRSEPFWQLVPKIEGETPTANTISSLRRHYAYAVIDNELFHLLLVSENRETLRNSLKETYLT